MQESGRQAVEHVELQILEATSVTEEDSLKRRVSTPDAFLASHPYATENQVGDDDFELGSDAQFGVEDDESYDLSDNSQLPNFIEDLSGLDEPETFRLQTSDEPALAEIPSLSDPVLQSPVSEPTTMAELSRAARSSRIDRTSGSKRVDRTAGQGHNRRASSRCRSNGRRVAENCR